MRNSFDRFRSVFFHIWRIIIIISNGNLSFQGLAISSDGNTLYGIEGDGALYSIDITGYKDSGQLPPTASWTWIANVKQVSGAELTTEGFQGKVSESLDFNSDGTELWVTDLAPHNPHTWRINLDPTDADYGKATHVQGNSPKVYDDDPNAPYPGTFDAVRAMAAETTKKVWIANDNNYMDFQSVDIDTANPNDPNPPPPDIPNLDFIGPLDDQNPMFQFGPKIRGMDGLVGNDEVLYGVGFDIFGSGTVYEINKGSGLLTQIGVGSLNPTPKWLALAVTTAGPSEGGSETGEIGDTVFCDLNENGAQDDGEPGIEGVTVNLTCSGDDNILGNEDDILLSQDTDTDGKYLFTSVPVGNCEVEVDITTAPDDKEPGICPITVNNISLGAGESFLDADFCFRELGEIGDTVFYDINNDGVQQIPGEPGIAGVDVVLECLDTDGTVLFAGIQTTDTYGKYLFTGVPAGSCTVTVEVGTAPANREPGICEQIVTVQLQPGQIHHDADFCFRD